MRTHINNGILKLTKIPNIRSCFCLLFSTNVEGCLVLTIIYVPELPENVLIKTESILLVGTGQKGVDSLERLCSQEGE